MKNLINYLKECDFTNPENTIGMGELGEDSGDRFDFPKANKKMKAKKMKKVDTLNPYKKK